MPTTRRRRLNSAHRTNGAAICGFMSANPRQTPLHAGRFSARTIASSPSVRVRRPNCSSVLKPPQHRNIATGNAALDSVAVGQIARTAR